MYGYGPHFGAPMMGPHYGPPMGMYRPPMGGPMGPPMMGPSMYGGCHYRRRPRRGCNIFWGINIGKIKYEERRKELNKMHNCLINKL